MLRNFRNSFRLLRIANTLARHDALFALEILGLSPWFLAPLRFLKPQIKGLRKGQRLARALETLGPSFIKLGQALSTRADLVGEQIAEDLSDLRDNIPPFTNAIVHETLTQELGAPTALLFASFEENPIAAASIAQVHFAVTQSGKKVAVKILRPGIEEAFARDIDLFLWLAQLAERALPAWRRLKPVEVVRTLEQSIAFELDLRLEAAAACELKENTKNDIGFYVPDIEWSLTSRRVLTLERIEGIPVGDIEALKAAGHDLNKIVEQAAHAFFNQVYRDGFFHADLHPGNLFVHSNGDLVVVDFGIMGRVDWQNRMYLAEILRGFLSGDYRHVAKMHFAAGYVPSDQSVDNFTLACTAIGKPIFGRPLNEISIAKLLGQLFQVAETFKMETQPQLLMLQKTMMLAEGVGRMLNPNVNMWMMAEPLIETWARENLSPQARIKEGLKDGLDILRELPALLKDARIALKRKNEQESLASPRPNDNPPSPFHYYWLVASWVAIAALTYWIAHSVG